MMNECLIFVSIYQVPRANLSFVSVTAFVPSFLLIGLTRSSKPVNSDAIDSSISELQKELSLLRAENRKLHRALADESLRHEACEELINLAESTYHIKVRKNSDAK